MLDKMSMNQEIKALGITRMQAVKWLMAIILPLLIMLIPVSETYTSEMRMFFILTGICILVMAFDLTEMIIPALALPLMYILSGLGTPAIVFKPWLGIVPWMNLFGLMLASILLSTGLLTRVAYWCIIKTGATYNGMLYAIMAAGIVFNFIIPGNTLLPMAALTYSICTALDLGKSKESAGIMLAGFFGSIIPGYMVYSNNFVMFQGVGMAVTDVSIPWLTYLIHNITLLPYSFLIIFMLTKVLKPDVKIEGKVYFEKAYKELGKLALTEKKAIVISIVLFAMFLTSSIHNIQPAWIFLILIIVSFLPGVNIGTKESLASVNYTFIFLITGCMAIGEVSSTLGVGQWISNMILGVISGSNIFVILVVVWLLAFLLNFLLTPVAIAAVVTVPLTEMALGLSISPFVIYYALMQGSSQIIFPYEWPFAFLFFSFGLIPIKHFIKVFSITSLMNLIYFMVIMIPFWRLIHLIG